MTVKKDALLIAEYNYRLFEAYVCKGFTRNEGLQLVIHHGLKTSEYYGTAPNPSKSRSRPNK